MQNQPVSQLVLNAVIAAQSEVWSQLNAQLIAESKRKKKRLHFLAALSSQFEFRTQQKSQRKTDQKSEVTLRLAKNLKFFCAL